MKNQYNIINIKIYLCTFLLMSQNFFSVDISMQKQKQRKLILIE